MTWTLKPFTAFDIETSGVDVESSRIVTAAVAYCGPDGVKTHSWLADPGVPIPAEAANVHGITTEHAQKHGRPAAEVLAEILDALTNRPVGSPIVAFNARFDLTILDRELVRHNLPALDCFPVLDPYVMDKHLDRFRRGKRTLSVMCGHYGARLDEAHEAAADAVAAARLAWKLGSSTKLGLLSLDELHDQQVGWAREQAESLSSYFAKQGRPQHVEPAWPVVPAELVGRAAA